MRPRIKEGVLMDNDIVDNVGKSMLKFKEQSPKALPFFASKARLIQRSTF